ncbi:hypothetical protein Q8A73_000882 [Channa argus]|nr:hypothetical protein Q8A73_000882 [Channa argus]
MNERSRDGGRRKRTVVVCCDGQLQLPNHTPTRAEWRRAVDARYLTVLCQRPSGSKVAECMCKDGGKHPKPHCGSVQQACRPLFLGSFHLCNIVIGGEDAPSGPGATVLSVLGVCVCVVMPL